MKCIQHCSPCISLIVSRHPRSGLLSRSCYTGVVFMNNKWVHFFMIGYLALDGGLKYCNQRVPVSVCLSVHSHVWKTVCPNFAKCSVTVNCGHGPASAAQEPGSELGPGAFDLHQRIISNSSHAYDEQGDNPGQEKRVWQCWQLE